MPEGGYGEEDRIVSTPNPNASSVPVQNPNGDAVVVGNRQPQPAPMPEREEDPVLGEPQVVQPLPPAPQPEQPSPALPPGEEDRPPLERPPQGEDSDSASDLSEEDRKHDERAAKDTALPCTEVDETQPTTESRGRATRSGRVPRASQRALDGKENAEAGPRQYQLRRDMQVETCWGPAKYAGSDRKTGARHVIFDKEPDTEYVLDGAHVWHPDARKDRWDYDNNLIIDRDGNDNRFKPGAAIETALGPGIYQGHTLEGKINLIQPGHSDNVAVYKMDAADVWLPEEKEDRFDYNGRPVRPSPEPPPSVIPATNLSAPLGGEANLVQRDSAKFARRSRFRDTDPDTLIGKTPYKVVDADLPPGFMVNTEWHPLHKHIEKGKARELQDMLHLPVCGEPQTLPEGAKAIDLMWVLTAKANEDGTYQRVKARLCLMGNQERTFLGKFDVYAPVANPVTYRVLFALHLGEEDVGWLSYDISQAYLSTPMKREVYVNHPPGYELYVNGKGQLTYRKCKLSRKLRSAMRLFLALYGGAECGRLFYDEFVKHHVGLGFHATHLDKCLLILFGPGNTFIKIVFHVDDGIICYRGRNLLQSYLQQVKKRFIMKYGPIKRFLGTNFEFSEDGTEIIMNQKEQIEKMLREFDEDEKNTTVPSPVLSGPLPTARDIPLSEERRAECRSEFDMYGAIGHMNWLQQCTRPDISFPLKILSSFAAKYGKRQIQWARHIMKWLRSTKTVPLRFKASNGKEIQIFTDASHASIPDTRRSITGVIVKIGGNTVSWTCTYQSMVSHSSCESELMSLDKGATIGMFVQWLMEVMGGRIDYPISIFVDNQSTINIATNPVQPGRNLHIHARYFYVRECVQRKIYEIQHLRSKDQISDILVTYKDVTNFRQLWPLLIGCAMVVKNDAGEYVWDTSMLG